jgi:Tripartite tricarboxylate transporter TctB family
LSKEAPEGQDSERRGLVKSPEDMAAGLFLLLFAAVLLWGAWDLRIGQLRNVGAGLMPKVTAFLLGVFGLLLVVQSLFVRGSVLQRWSLRGPVFVLGAILLFAATIRGVDFGIFKLPALGLVVSGPLAVFVSALADPQTRIKEAAIYALLLTAACIGVFKYALRLPIPLAPWLLGY